MARNCFNKMQSWVKMSFMAKNAKHVFIRLKLLNTKHV